VKIEQTICPRRCGEVQAGAAADPKNVAALDVRAEQLVVGAWNEAVATASARWRSIRRLAARTSSARSPSCATTSAPTRPSARTAGDQSARVGILRRQSPSSWSRASLRRGQRARGRGAQGRAESRGWRWRDRSNWLRLGEDQKGLEALRQAWKRNPYNVRTYNLLQLFEDVIPNEYVLVEGTPFRFPRHQGEQPVLLHYVKRSS